MRMRSFIALVLAGALAGSAAAAETVMKLPAPKQEGGKPLMQCLKERRSQRAFSKKTLPDQLLSDLLWAADGVNRADGRRTAPSTMDLQEIEVYVVKADGCYLYDPAANTLRLTVAGDIRAATGFQPFAATAPVDLVFVADLKRTGRMGKETEKYTGADAAFISQNVYLFCASEGLATVVRGALNPETLAAAMKLGKDRKVIFAQTVGYPE